MKKCNTNSDYILLVKNLYAGYEGRNVLAGLHLALAPGEKCLLTGSNGTGKTTLLRVLLGLHPPSGGRILFNQSPLEPEKFSWKGRQMHRRCAYVNQHMVNANVPFSSWEIAAMGIARARLPGPVARKRISRALDRTGVLHLKKKPYNELSGGQKQRVQIARCLTQGAEILMLDEPLASLDPESKESIVSVLQNLRQTVLVVSHEHDLFCSSQWFFRKIEGGVVI